MTSGYSFWADLVVTFHLFYIIFAVGGQAVILVGLWLKWRFVRLAAFRIAHLIAVAFVAFEAVIGMVCPLTEWENNLRQLAGQSVDRDISFVARLIRMIIFYDFPQWVFSVMHILFGLVVIMTFVFAPPRFQKKGCN